MVINYAFMALRRPGKAVFPELWHWPPSTIREAPLGIWKKAPLGWETWYRGRPWLQELQGRER